MFKINNTKIFSSYQFLRKFTCAFLLFLPSIRTNSFQKDVIWHILKKLVKLLNLDICTLISFEKVFSLHGEFLFWYLYLERFIMVIIQSQKRFIQCLWFEFKLQDMEYCFTIFKDITIYELFHLYNLILYVFGTN